MTLSELIINYRRTHEISQRQLAAQCGLSTGYISLVEKEVNPQTHKKMVPSLVVLNKLSKGMGMTLDELLNSIDDMPVNMSEKTALIGEDGFDEFDLEILTILSTLSSRKKQEAIGFLRYLEGREDK